MKYESFKDTSVWQLTIRLIEDIYNLTKTFPNTEKFGLVNQMRRSSLSISGNIAESWGRYHYADKVRVLYIARGEIEEVRNYLEISKRLLFITEEKFVSLDTLCKLILEELNKYKKTLINSGNKFNHDDNFN